MTASDMDSVARVLTFETPARRPGAPLPTATPIGGGATPEPAPLPTIVRASPHQAAKASPSLLLRRVSFGNQGAAPTPLSASRQPAPAASGGASGGSRPTSSFRAPSPSSSEDGGDGDYEVDYDYAERLRSGESRPWAPVARPVPVAARAPFPSTSKGGGSGRGGRQALSYSVPYSSSEDEEGVGDENNLEVSSVWRQQQQQQQRQRSGGARGGPATDAVAARGRPHLPFGGGATTDIVPAAETERHPHHHHHHHHHRLASEEAPELSLVEAAAAAAAAAASARGGGGGGGRRRPAPPPPPIHPVDPVRLALAGRAREAQRAASAIAASDASRLRASLAGEAARLKEGLRGLALEAGLRAADLSAAELRALDAREGSRARAQDDLRREHAAASAAYTAALERSAAAAAAAAAVERRKAAERAAAAEAEAEGRRRLRAQEQEQERRRQQQAAAAAAEAKAQTERESAMARAQQEQQQQQQQQRQQQQAAATAAAAAAAATGAAAVASAPKPQQRPPGAPLSSSSSKGPFPVRAGRSALERAAELSVLLADAEAACAALQGSDDPQLKRERRALERRVTVLVSQVSGTQAQVAARAADLASVLLGAPERGGARLLACLALASRLLSQCEGQVATLASFAFPLAFVACRVGCRVPHFFGLLLARLQRACPMLVPAWSAYTKSCAERGLAREDHQRAIGFKSVDWVGGDAPPPGADGEPPRRLETSDEFTARQSGYVAFYAALLQCDADPEAGSAAAAGGGGGGGSSSVFGAGASAARRPAAGPSPGPPPLPPADLAALRALYGLPGAWAYVARVLNHVPASRTSAAALMAFLNTAGRAMHAAYGGQFVKLLHSLYDAFLPDLAAHGDPDARAVGTRLRTYLERAQYAEAPEGRDLPLQDESSYTRAT